MHKHAVTRYGVVVILATICCHVYAANLDVAREALRSYFNAAVSGDTLMINNTTTKEARGVETIGLRAYYYAVYRQSTGEELSAEYKILEESEGPGYVKFLVSDPLLANHSRWFFLTFQDSSWRITAPYKILCADYCHIETDHFVIYWSNKKSSISPHLDIRPSLLSLTKMEELYDRVSELLRYEVPYKIEYYICPSVGDPDLFLHGLEGGKHQGHNSIDSRVCFAIHPYNAHVLTHAISISAIQKKTPPHPISILREGLATAFQWPDARIGHIPSVILVKNMLQEKSCPTLDSVICCYGSIPLEKNYPISATFVLFLLEMYGEDRFRSLWYNHPHDNPHAFIDYVETMYGRSITELEDEWKGWVNEEVEKLNVGIEYEYNQILTTNWQSTESEYFVVHHKADEKPSAKILGQTDSLYVNINDRIGLNPLTRIDYFKCSDFDEMYFTFGQPNSYGGLACETTIVSLTHLDSFQIAYSLVKRLGCKYEPIVDGAVFVLATGGNRGNAADSTVKRLAQTDSLISLVMDYDLISGNRNMKKQFLKQWRSFCHYLVLEYSLEAFLTLIRNSSNLGFLLQEARSIYKKDLMALQREWIESLGLE